MKVEGSAPCLEYVGSNPLTHPLPQCCHHCLVMVKIGFPFKILYKPQYYLARGRVILIVEYNLAQCEVILHVAAMEARLWKFHNHAAPLYQEGSIVPLRVHVSENLFT